MRIVNQGNGLWGIDRDGERVVTDESYQVVSNICEMSVQGLPEETDEVRATLQRKSLHRRLLEAAAMLHFEIEMVQPSDDDPRIRYRIRGANRVQLLTPGEAADFFGIPS